MRSVVVVLPASICAMMPMFLHRSSGTVLDTAFFLSSLRDSCSLATEPVKSLSFSSPQPMKIRLPAIVREGLVGRGHAVYVFFLFNGCATVVAGVQQFVAQLVDHTLFGPATGISDQPADRQ